MCFILINHILTICIIIKCYLINFNSIVSLFSQTKMHFSFSLEVSLHFSAQKGYWLLVIKF